MQSDSKSMMDGWIISIPLTAAEIKQRDEAAKQRKIEEAIEAEKRRKSPGYALVIRSLCPNYRASVHLKPILLDFIGEIEAIKTFHCVNSRDAFVEFYELDVAQAVVKHFKEYEDQPKLQVSFTTTSHHKDPRGRKRMGSCSPDRNTKRHRQTIRSRSRSRSHSRGRSRGRAHGRNRSHSRSPGRGAGATLNHSTVSLPSSSSSSSSSATPTDVPLSSNTLSQQRFAEASPTSHILPLVPPPHLPPLFVPHNCVPQPIMAPFLTDILNPLVVLPIPPPNTPALIYNIPPLIYAPFGNIK